MSGSERPLNRKPRTIAPCHARGESDRGRPVAALIAFDPKYRHLSFADRAIVEILQTTKPDLPDYFRPVPR